MTLRGLTGFDLGTVDLGTGCEVWPPECFSTVSRLLYLVVGITRSLCCAVLW